VVATEGTWRELESAGDDWRWAVAPALAASVVLLLVTAAFLFARRVIGALDTPLAPVPLALTAVGLLAWACAVRLRLRDRRVDWLLPTVLLLFAIGCSFPGHRAVDWLVWLTVMAAYGLIPATTIRRGGRCPSSPASGSVRAAEQILQQLTRSRTADGCQVIHGTLVAEFVPGERTATLHVAFCPPFERLPQVEAAADDCDVKVVQVLHQGARLDVRLGRVCDIPKRVTVEILATDRQSLAV
jgi:hypothetical protein